MALPIASHRRDGVLQSSIPPGERVNAMAHGRPGRNPTNGEEGRHGSGGCSRLGQESASCSGEAGQGVLTRDFK
jgi:hypothetical protein